MLSHDEVHRAERFYFDDDRRRYIVGRAVLRCILSAYTSGEAGNHSFTHNPYGKPSLISDQSLCFNASYSKDKAIYAIVRDRDVGIDIEYIKPLKNVNQIVDNFFSKSEKTLFHGLPEHLRNRAFYDCWTRKEAYLKALGTGLSRPLNSFSVSFIPGQPARLASEQPGMKGEPAWSIREVRVDANHAAAVVVKGNSPHFQHRRWSF